MGASGRVGWGLSVALQPQPLRRGEARRKEARREGGTPGGRPASRPAGQRASDRASTRLLDVGRDVLLDVVLLQGLRGALHRVLLHLLRHVRVLDHGLPVAHGCLHTGDGAREGRRALAVPRCRACRRPAAATRAAAPSPPRPQLGREPRARRRHPRRPLTVELEPELQGGSWHGRGCSDRRSRSRGASAAAARPAAAAWRPATPRARPRPPAARPDWPSAGPGAPPLAQRRHASRGSFRPRFVAAHHAPRAASVAPATAARSGRGGAGRGWEEGRGRMELGDQKVPGGWRARLLRSPSRRPPGHRLQSRGPVRAPAALHRHPGSEG